MAESFSELVEITSAAGAVTVRLDANTATLSIGTAQNEGDLIVRDASDRQVLRFNGEGAGLIIGATGNDGDLTIRDAADRNAFNFNGDNARLIIGAQDNDGDLRVRDGSNRDVFHIDATNAQLAIGNTGNGGDLVVRDGDDRNVFHFNSSNATLTIGAQGNEGDIRVHDGNGNETIHLNGGTGDIVLSNADVAEQFQLAETIDALPGTVMVLAGDGTIIPASAPYDRTVVGVIAGAGAYRPGILMDHREGGSGRRVPIAVLGKVSCRADARYGAIRIGDLLTTSPNSGHAMRASDMHKAFGAIIGKALAPLDRDMGMIDIIVCLQ